MGNFSGDTFNKLKHYVSVRLQQGVPIVDTDWNEAFDIRKYELRTFLKWFVGDGVPKGDDGFRIHSPVGQALDPGSSPTQGRARVQGLPPVSGPQGPSGLEPGPGLPDVEPGPGLPDVEPGPGLPDVEPGPGLPDIAHIPLNDFEIKAGRCLVEGWEVINEESLWYQEQFLYDKPKTAEEWGVPPLTPLDPPADGTTRRDLVYLDVWEREVDSTEDYKHLVHPDINIETCVRLKREWVVRVAEGVAGDVDRWAPPDDIVRPDHAYYPLALLSRKGGQKVIRKEDITDLRLTGLSVMSHYDVQQIVADAYGSTYTLDHDGQPNLKVSLREAINAILRGGLPSTPELPLTADAGRDQRQIALEDSNGDIWVFWESNRSGNFDIWYNRYNRASDSWAGDTQLTTDPAHDIRPLALEDSDGDIWVFWEAYRSGNHDIWYNRYDHASGKWWENDEPLTTDPTSDRRPFALEDSNGDIWVFWESDRSGNFDIWYNRYDHASGEWWENDEPLTTGPRNDFYPFALEDSNGDIWVFWVSFESERYDIWYNCCNRASGEWEGEEPLTKDTETEVSPFTLEALEDSNGDIWVFWVSDRSGGYDIWYHRYIRARDAWEEEAVPVTKDKDDEPQPGLFAIADNHGGIWVFWGSRNAYLSDIWYKHYSRDGGWGRAVQLTTALEFEYGPSALEDSSGDIWVFWRKLLSDDNSDVWYKKLIPAV